MLNNVTLAGRLGADPEIKYFDSGKAKARMRLAVDRPTKEKKTDWIDVELWGKAAESAVEHLKKGSVVGVIGAIEVNEYETDDGTKKRFVYVNANTWRFVGGKSEAGGNGGGSTSRGEDDIPF